MFHKEGFRIIIFSFLMSTSLVISIEILAKVEMVKNILQIIVHYNFGVPSFYVMRQIQNLLYV